ncbi:MAG: M55 family metallopeptidase [Chloroflexi bacterium]|nr:M55 family metallopeptidase [Chloroflexota bacterium]
MKALISVDMEGITGVTNMDQVTPGHAEWQRFRRVMTGDANATIKGAAQGGIDEFIVSDGHWDGTNILLEELDPRARLNAGLNSPFSMLEGIDSGVVAAFFIGYHARNGSSKAVLDHTWSSRVANVWLNGSPCGEIGLGAALCGHFDIPVIMISGDQTATAEASELLPGIECTVVKRATGRMSAECLPLEVSHLKIRESAARATSRLRMNAGPRPFVVSPPILLAVEFIASHMADRASLLPEATRLDARRIQFTVPDMPTAFRIFRAAVELTAA